MLVLVRALLMDFRSLAFGPFVPVRRGFAFGITAGHSPLGLGELGGTTLAVTQVGQVEGRVGGRGGGGHTPVDADGTRDVRGGLDLAADHERRIPVAARVLAGPLSAAPRGWTFNAEGIDQAALR
jgi:hypothetical protein